MIYKVSNGDWFHAVCYESSWDVCAGIAAQRTETLASASNFKLEIRKCLPLVEKDETINPSRLKNAVTWLKKTLLPAKKKSKLPLCRPDGGRDGSGMLMWVPSLPVDKEADERAAKWEAEHRGPPKLTPLKKKACQPPEDVG
jgi:hypothetical protein